ncbi:MAG: serine/threonine protein kinase [Anaerolineae bacterium]|nr:serine/threonine protein kinase [Anaerolineae bacterium]
MSNDTLLNNRYRLIQQIGSGGMAVIYKAQDLSLGRTVAIKILRPSLTSDASFAARFKNEARSVANLSHPNIVTVYDFGTSENTQFLVMEFVDGQDLKKVIKAEFPLTLDRVLNFGIQICAGIGFAHRAGIVHADIKPQNILVTREDVLKVTDFGIAQALASGTPGERQAVVWGSPHYFSPEQARGERPTTASDVYSIGIVMFEMLTGRPPYSGKDQRELALAHLQAPVPMVTEINPNVPPNLAQIVYRTMSKDPAQRYRMADQLGNVLKSYQERERGIHVSTPPPMPPATLPQMPQQPAYQQQRPLDPVPTQRVDLAPSPPQFGGYAPPVANPYPVQNSAPASQPYNSQSYSAPYIPGEGRHRSSLDIPTMVLALLAFMSVACLIPLYIAVFQARF